SSAPEPLAWEICVCCRLLFVASLSCSGSVIATSERAVRLFALDALTGCLPFAEVNNLVPATAVEGGVTMVSELLFETWHRTSPSSLDFQEISSSDSSVATSGTPGIVLIPSSAPEPLAWEICVCCRLLFVASLSCSGSVIATSERAVRLFALDALTGCLPFAEVNNLVPATAVEGGVTVVSELLFVFQTLALVFGGVAPVATA
nr:hypothetical protein [Tanacetum cinerariifolium]